MVRQFSPVENELTSVALASYYLAEILNSVGVTNPKTQLLINGLLQVVNFITAFTMCFFVDKFGRRRLFLISTAGMLGVFIVWTIASERQQSTKSAAAGNTVVVASSIRRAGSIG
jgi:MFS family permease